MKSDKVVFQNVPEMRTTCIRRSLLLGFVALAAFGAPAAIRTWTNAAGDGDWHNAENWADGALPSASDVAHVTIAGDTTLTITSDVQVARFWTSGTGTLTVAPGADGTGSIYANVGNSYRYYVFSNAVAAVYNVPVKIRGTNEPRFRFAGATTFNRKFTFEGGQKWSLDHLANGSTLTFNDELVAENETIELSAGINTGVSYKFYGKVTAKTFGQNNNAGTAVNLYGAGNDIGTLTAERFGTVNLMITNALMDKTVLKVGQNEKGGVLDLNGNNQVANRLTAATTTDARTSDSYCVKSSDPCTLTLKGSANAKTTTGLGGKLSLVWDPTGSFTQSFTNRQLKTSGSITVKGGAVALTGSSSAPNLTSITVASGASMKFLTSTASPLTAGKCAATIAAGGTLEVGEGVTVSLMTVRGPSAIAVKRSDTNLDFARG